MSKKTKILGVTLAALALVIAGTVGIVTVASAEEPTPAPTTTAAPKADLLARVAEILGIDKQRLTDAYNQARQELAQKALENALANAVANGKITQTEADQILSWWKQKPEVLNKGVFPGLGKFGFRGGRMWGPCIHWEATQSTTPSTT